MQAELNQRATPNNNHATRNKMLTALISILLLIGIIYLIYWLVYARFYESTDDAYVGGNMAQVMPQIAGTVIAINGDDTKLVQQGQALIILDPINVQLAFNQAQENLANTLRNVQTLYQNAAQSSANANLRQVQLIQAQQDLKRREKLVASHAIAPEDYQHAKDAVSVASSALQLAQHEADSAKILVANTTVLTYPSVQQAITNLRMAYLDLLRATIIAPVTGYIAKRTVELGEHVAPGAPLMSIIPLNQLWVDANFREVQLQHLKRGQTVELISDVYGSNVVYHGIVVGLGAGTGSAFSLLPAENATGNWIKIVQRVPVRIALNPQELAEHPLRIGLSMRVNVDIHSQTGRNVAEMSTYQPSYFTTIYDKQQQDQIDEIIHKIIINNLVSTS
jgi:membrane fusion protein (multidrug efflux system)